MSSKQGAKSDYETLAKQRSAAQDRSKVLQEEKDLKAIRLAKNRKIIKAKLRKTLNEKNKKSLWDSHSYKITFGGLGALLVVVVVSQLFGMGRNLSKIPVLEDEFIRRINEDGRSFKVKANNFFEGWTLADAKKILNNGITNSNRAVKCAESKSEELLETKYNWSTDNRWCVSPIFSQGKCSSSFAVSAIGSFNDRYCKINNGLKKYDASIQHVLACDKKGSQGCKGGYIASTFELGKVKGLVTSTCMKYDVDSADSCDVEHLSKCYRRKVDNFCVAEGVEAIKREIRNNGPVASVMPVTREFLVYGSGVYDVTPDSFKLGGSHAVKIIGWGTNKEGTDYWIIENSFGESWGIKGYGKVKIGLKGSLLDKVAVAVTPNNGDVIKN